MSVNVGYFALFGQRQDFAERLPFLLAYLAAAGIYASAAQASEVLLRAFWYSLIFVDLPASS